MDTFHYYIGRKHKNCDIGFSFMVHTYFHFICICKKMWLLFSTSFCFWFEYKNPCLCILFHKHKHKIINLCKSNLFKLQLHFTFMQHVLLWHKNPYKCGNLMQRVFRYPQIWIQLYFYDFFKYRYDRICGFYDTFCVFIKNWTEEKNNNILVNGIKNFK